MNEYFEIENKTLRSYQGDNPIVTIPEEVDRIDGFIFSESQNLNQLIIPNTLKSIGDFSLPLSADIIVKISLDYHTPQPIPPIGPIYLYLVDESGTLKGILTIPDHYQNEPYQQFVNRLAKGQVEHLSEYDELFHQSEQIIVQKVKIALNRLFYPFELDDKYRQRYIRYLRKHAHMIVPKLIESSNVPMISILAEIEALLPEHIDAYIDQASKHPEIETLAVLMDYKDRIRDQVKPPSLEIKETQAPQLIWEYEENEDGTLTINRYHDGEIEVTIPSIIDGRRVTRLEGSIGSLKVSILHPNTRNVKSVIIEEGIEEIGKRAFLDCANLVSVTIPPSVKVLGEQAFAGCSKLELIFPKSVPTIGESAFSGIKELGIDYAEPPANLDKLGVEGLYIDLLETDYTIVAKLYIPNYTTYEGEHPYLSVVKQFIERRIKSLSEYDELFINHLDLLDKGYVSLSRLEYPYQLLDKDRVTYFRFLLENEHLLIPNLIRGGNQVMLKALAKLNVICWEYLDLYIQEARDCSKTEIKDVLEKYQKTILFHEEHEIKKVTKTPSAEDWVIEGEDIIWYNGNQLIVTFPSEVNGQKIKRVISGDNNRYVGDSVFRLHGHHVISVIVEEGIEMIGIREEEDDWISEDERRVFRNCTNLKRVQLPSSIRAIHDEAFWGCEKVTIHAPKGSYAIEYAKENGIKYVET